MLGLKKKANPKYIILIGPQSSGKGSYSSALCEKYGIVHIATGDLLRENIKNGTKLGMKAQSYMNAGLLVPDKLVINLIKKRLKQPDAQNGAVFDGFPRNLAQAKVLLKKVGVAAVINVQIPDETVVKRCLNRRVCNGCGNIGRADRLKKDEACAKCGGKYILRDDDKQEAIEKRLQNFYEQTMPVVKFFNNVVDIKGNKIFFEIDATPEVNIVVNNIMSKLDKIFILEDKKEKGKEQAKQKENKLEQTPAKQPVKPEAETLLKTASKPKTAQQPKPETTIKANAQTAAKPKPKTTKEKTK